MHERKYKLMYRVDVDRLNTSSYHGRMTPPMDALEAIRVHAEMNRGMGGCDGLGFMFYCVVPA